MFLIYGTDNCIYCLKAKELLTRYDKEYTFINVAENSDITAAFFEKFPNVSRVPQIMWDGHDRGYEVHIGGYKELEKWVHESVTK